MTELILALDTPRGADALRLLDQLPVLQWVKVGSILMTREGPDFVRQLTARGLKVFLDLKWHDIPNTVAGAVTAARELDVSMATVHTLGGSAMLEAAAVAAGGELALVGVTVLVAVAAGLQGIVCSPQEVSLLRRRLGPEPLIVVPGIRRRSDPASDQARVATAKDAVVNGATHLVVGRPILQAVDPASAFEEFLEEAR
jgi:orotidine-5'-phosphate decarboxylase